MKRLLILVSLCICSTTIAQLPDDYSDELIQSGYAGIMGTIFNVDGTKMFAWTQAGEIYLSNWNGNAYIKQNAAVLDISDEVSGYRDFGMLSICLDPDFETNGYIYLFYTVDRHHLLHYGTGSYNANTNDYYKASISRITRYTLNHQLTPMTTDYASRLVLLGESISTGVPLTHESHAGGTLMFGSDGTLLVTTGDNASYTSTDTGSRNETYYQQALNDGIMRSEENVGAFRSQMINSLCGKVLRMDPLTGDGISSNPFYDSNNPRSAESRMWAMGLRNPFRASINIATGSLDPNDANPGTLFVADVGWGTWEDIHVIDKPGLNAGWPLYEGQTALNSYYTSGTINPDESPATFVSLCTQPTSFVDDAIPSNRRFVHRRPSATWKHGSNRVRVPYFSGSTPTDPRVGGSGSPTTGIEFRGNTAIAGPFVVGTAFGADFEGKLLFSDYKEDWINAATLNPSNTPWFNHIEQLAPSDYGNGIVHIFQNPLDGSMFYVNINLGTIRRISFYDDTLSITSNELNEIKILPNPVNNLISISGITNQVEIEIYNLSGQILLSRTAHESLEIPISLSSGLYLVKLQSNSGNQILKKIIVN